MYIRVVDRGALHDANDAQELTLCSAHNKAGTTDPFNCCVFRGSALATKIVAEDDINSLEG